MAPNENTTRGRWVTALLTLCLLLGMTALHAQNTNPPVIYYGAIANGQEPPWYGTASTFEEAALATLEAHTPCYGETCVPLILDHCDPGGAPTPTNMTSSCWIVSPVNGPTWGLAFNILAHQAPPIYFLKGDPAPSRCSKQRPCIGDPINPTLGIVYQTETDIGSRAPMTIGFQRFYASDESGGADLGPGWRHTFGRSIKLIQSDSVPGGAYPALAGLASQAYASASAACVNGFADIQPKVTAWANATVSWSDSDHVCVLNGPGGAFVGTVVVESNVIPPPLSTSNEYDVIRDDGAVYRFPILGGVITNLPGASQHLTATASGFTLTDDDDTVETYDSMGNLLTVTTRAGYVQTMSNDSSGRLSSITDSFGNVLNLSRNASGLLSSVALNGASPVTYAYNQVNQLTSVTAADSTSRQYQYNTVAFPTALTAEIDEAGKTYASWTYDSTGRATGSSFANGVDPTTVTYNADQSFSITNGLGATRNLTFTRNGDQAPLSSVTGTPCLECGDAASITYDAAGWTASRTDFNGNLTCYANEPARGLELVRVEGIAPGGACPSNLATYTPTAGTAQRKITTTWHASLRVPMSVTEANRTTTFSYDTAGNVLTRTVTDTSASPNVSRTWTYTYNAYGQVLTVDGPRSDVSDVTTYAYYTCSSGSQCGQIHTITNALGQITTFNTYNAYGQPLTITDPNGVLNTLTYDARQRLTSRQVGSELTSFSYWPTGLLKQVTLPDASFLVYTYDDAHRLVDIKDELGNTIDYTLDVMGNRTAEVAHDPSNVLHRTHSRVFNTLNQLFKDINAAGTAAVTTVYGYDANGNQTSVAAPLSRSTGNSYDALNRLKQVTDPASGTTQFGYDAQDNLTSVTDPRSLSTQYSYTGFGDLSNQVSPDTGTTGHTYDTAGNLATSTDARGAISTYTYDALNRVSSIAYSLGGATDQTVSFSYDSGTNGLGRLTSASDANHSLNWTYDNLGRITHKTQVAGGVSLGLGYSYTNGNLTTVTLPSGRTVTYGYNANHQVTSVSVGTTQVLGTVTYEPFGAVNGWTWGNGTVTTRTFDTDQNVQTIASGGISKTYGTDNASRITGITDASSASLSWSYGYDLLDRLNSATTSTRNESWTYDGDGNRLTQGGGSNSTYSPATTSNRLTGVTGALARTYSYDNAGNTLSDGSHTFTYNDAGRMASASGSAGAATYLYNAQGQRIGKSTPSGSTFFMYDEGGHLIGEYDGTGNVIQEIVWLGDTPVASVRTELCGLSIFYIHTDHLNTPRAITRRSTADIVWRWDSDPFGTDQPNENPSGLGAFTFNLRFPGQYSDQESGLNYNYFRDYDAAVGRYIESDPILRPSRDVIEGRWVFAVPLALKKIRLLLPYAFVADQPIVGSDPRGLFWPIDFIKCLYYSSKYLDAAQGCRGCSGSSSQEQINFMSAYQAPSMSGAVLHCACLNAGPGVCQNMWESCGKTGTGAPKMVE